MSRDLRVLVIGGGIGGLTLAIALRRAGYEARVFERSPELTTVGAGLHLWSNAMAVYTRIGLRTALLDIGYPVERFEFRTSADRTLASWPIGTWQRETGAPPSIGVRRADLHEVLARHIDNDVVHLDSTCIGFEQDGQQVTGLFANGRKETGDVLVGADGLHSVVRAQLHGNVSPNFTGTGSWRALVDAAGIEHLLRRGVHCIWYGAGRRFVIYPVGGSYAYWELFTNATLDQAKAAMTPEQLLDSTEGFPTVVRQIGRATLDRGSILTTPICDRDPIERWGSGRVTMLGDAAHPMTPSVGQGAAQAIEDASALVARLVHRKDPVEALRSYERERRGPTKRLQRMARVLGAVSRWEHPVAMGARAAFLAPWLRLGGQIHRREMAALGSALTPSA